MSEIMELTEKTLEQIGTYVREHLGAWVRNVNSPLTVQMDPGFLERMVRVEEELKVQRDLMKQGFAQMEKRFEAVDRRFETIDRRFEEHFALTNARFEDARHHSNRWMGLLTFFLGLMTVAITVTNLM